MSIKTEDFNNIPKEKFEFYKREEDIHDKKLETKPVGYFKDAFIRFRKNKSSVIAAVIIVILISFAIFAPILFRNKYTDSLTDTTLLQYGKLLPKSEWFASLGWDGCKNTTIAKDIYNKYVAIGIETGMNPIKEVYRADYEHETAVSKTTFYDVRLDSYTQNGMVYLNLTEDEYKDIQKWQNETKIQVIYPAVDTSDIKVTSMKNDANIWYKCTNKGLPKLDKDGNYTPAYKTKGSDGDYDSIRIASDPGTYRYAVVTGNSEAKSYKVRVFTYTYFQYRYGFEPSFLFGTNAYGQDIITRLGNGARFSFIFAIVISSINLFIGAIYGAIEGYYGGKIDLTMERISDILAGIPFLVVTALFRLHLEKKVGPVGALLFAYVLTGWIGMASSVRMQFYRYKNQEYVLAARTLGARDRRLMFRHIFPNALGTLITGAVLTIPGVINSESTLTYLGIVNLESGSITSVGTMLAAGKESLTSFPHMLFFPALFISLLMITFNLFGNGLRDAFNPSLRGTED